jgi:hypothetical protein
MELHSHYSFIVLEFTLMPGSHKTSDDSSSCGCLQRRLKSKKKKKRKLKERNEKEIQKKKIQKEKK